MTQYEMVVNKLKELNIEFEQVNHPPALTTEEADKYIEGMEGVRTKTMFLTNKKKTDWFLVVMDDLKRLDMERFEEIAQTKRVKMASPESLMEKMGLPPGTVSIFGLLNNEDHDIKVYFDKEIMSEEIMTFHPNTNEITMFIRTADMMRYFEDIGYEVNVVEL
ncbi:MAG: prolyl-tRNA synthetase associated domain-containing protein [Firmicutes bacterium]|nr:prolyl-tRNA synthetase associated domain-containing protein [Bacillota bacterium]